MRHWVSKGILAMVKRILGRRVKFLCCSADGTDKLPPFGRVKILIDVKLS
jgi:hypothetical protein